MKRVWMFPGQGSQEIGMGRQLLETDEIKSLLYKAEGITGRKIGDIIRNGPKEALDLTSNTQVGILVVSLGMVALLRSRGEPLPDAVVGHSAGEVSAAVVAGHITDEEAIDFIHHRGLAMEEAGELYPGGMAAILGVDESVAERIAEQNGAVIANYNVPNQQYVASGNVESIGGVVQTGEEEGSRVMRLGVSIAAHSPLMAGAVDRVRGAISGVDVREGVIPMISNASGQFIEKASELKEHLPGQLIKPVRWSDGVRFLHGQGVREFVEVGPRNVLAGMVKRQLRGIDDIVIKRAEDEISR